MYDIIGDIHGHAAELEALLEKLGYTCDSGVWEHPRRQAIFLGDFIDRGPGCRQVLQTVQDMSEEGTGFAVMGNHELNALAYHTKHPERPGEFLRPHSEKNTKQHQATLDQLSEGDLWSALEWFWTLPLWLDLHKLRIVHACWDDVMMQALLKAGAVHHMGLLMEKGLHAASIKGNPIHGGVELLLKGMERELPDGISYEDKEGHVRSEIRVTWWDAAGKSTWRELAMGPKELRDKLPADRGPDPRIDASYPKDAPPVFVGHYWLSGTPGRLASNVACVDYSVAKPGGALCAYRWDGEQEIDDSKFVTVSRA